MTEAKEPVTQASITLRLKLATLRKRRPGTPTHLSISAKRHGTRLRRLNQHRGYGRSRKSAHKPWPAPGSEDTELGVLVEPEVDHGEAEVYARVQA